MTTEKTLSVIKLQKNADRRLRGGHNWIYSNEIDNKATPIKDFEAGQLVEVVNNQDKWLGAGYINPNSLIAVRLISRQKEVKIDSSLIVHRLNVALSLRERFYTKPYYRLIFGDSDGLSGLVIDRYGDYCVIAITTAGMELLRDEIVAALVKVLKPIGILYRNNSAIREQEGLKRYTELAYGDIPETVQIEEGGCKFEVSLLEGQKTGWFYDQEANRSLMLKYVKDKKVLDVCSYIGAWSVRAAVAGAEQVTSVDASDSALTLLEKNADLNQVSDKIEVLQGDAFDALKQLKQEERRFDVIILDPPAFMKRKKDVKQGLIAYRRLNEMAIRLLNKDGILISASCSFHLSAEDLMKTIQQAARHSDRLIQILESGQQGIDHPVHPAITETAYLKAFYCRVLRNT